MYLIIAVNLFNIILDSFLTQIYQRDTNYVHNHYEFVYMGLWNPKIGVNDIILAQAYQFA